LESPNVSAAAQAPFLSLGTPRFVDAALAEVAKTQGPRAAVLAALAAGAQVAAAALDGDFAVATTDERGRTFLAVDRFAIRTLCYRRIGTQLHFAQRADELAALEPAAEIDPQAVFDYLYHHVVPAPRTAFKDVFRLPAGHYAWFDGSALTVAPYWVADFATPPGADFDTMTTEFKRVLRVAVADGLDGGKAGCFLSGGTDSSTVAGVMSKLTGGAASGYSIGFDAEGYDEMSYARLAAKRFGLKHHEYYVTPTDLLQGIPLVARAYDQPFGNSSAVPAYFCARLAREDGVSTILAGDGGDELFGGNARYATQRVCGWYQGVPAPLRSGLLEPVLQRSPVGALPLLRKGRSYITQARMPLPDRMQQYNLLTRLGVDEVLTPGFMATVDMQAPARQQREVWASAKADNDLDRMLAFDWRYTLAEADLPKVRGTTAMAGLNVSFPLLHPEVLAFSMKLPQHYKLKGLKLRWFFKEALRGFLPDEIITKKKHGFGLPFGVWVVRDPALHALASDALASLGTRGIVRPEFIKQLLTTHLPAHPGYYGEMVWILMMLELWIAQVRPGYALSA
jgi:asparagine synthase (glutamine-hydrolysing)